MIAQQGSFPSQKLNTPHPPLVLLTYFTEIVEKSNTTVEPLLFLSENRGALPCWVKSLTPLSEIT